MRQACIGLGSSPGPTELCPSFLWCPAAHSGEPLTVPLVQHASTGWAAASPGRGCVGMRIAHSYIRRYLCCCSKLCPFVPPLEERDVPCQSTVLQRNDTLSWGPGARSRQLPVLLPCQAEPQEILGTYAFSLCSSFHVKSLLEKYA